MVIPQCTSIDNIVGSSADNNNNILYYVIINTMNSEKECAYKIHHYIFNFISR